MKSVPYFKNNNSLLYYFFRKLTYYAKCLETSFDPRAPPDSLLEGDFGYVFRGIANTVKLTKALCTNGSYLREGNHKKINLYIINF